MQSRYRAYLTAALAALVLGGGVLGSASADESGLSADEASSEESVLAPHSNRAATVKRAPAAADRSGFGPRKPSPQVVLLDEPLHQDAPPVPLAADITDQTLGMGLSTEPALAASLVALGCLASWRTRRKLAKRGLWAH